MSDPARAALDRTIAGVRSAVAAVDDRLPREIDEAEASARAAGRTVVVVVGEVKQGKSSLVNALVGRPGTSPVDVTVTTSTYLLFRSGGPEGATLHLADGAPPVQVPVADLPAWATPDAPAPVRYAEVTVAAPWLDDLVLVDTPGAGGLVAAHATAALEAAGRASALLFVTDALAPLSGVELDFLRQVSERVETVVFALTKIGPQPGWSAVLDENKANLAAAAPRFASARWVAVDSRLAAQALESLDAHPSEVGSAAGVPDEDVTDALEDWEESGVGELLDVVRTELAPAAETLAAANTLRAVRSIAARADRELALRLAQLQADPALEEAVAEHHRRLVELEDEQRTWAPRLEKDLNLLRIDINRQLATRVDDQRDRWSERLRTLRRAPDDATFARLCDELQGDLGVIGRDVLALTCTRFRAVAGELFAELADTASVVTALDSLGTDAVLPSPSRLPPNRSHGVKDTMDLYYGWLMGSGLGGGAGAAVVALTGLGPLGWALGAVGGVAGIALRHWVTRDSGRQADVRAALTSWITQAEAEIRSEVERNTVQARFSLAEAFRAALQQAKAEAQEFLDASKAARQRSAAELAAQRTALETQRRTLAKHAERVDTLLRSPLAVPPGRRTAAVR
ncbi:50S ribosome-binding GTPase [Geodermatophilus pulveris]|uniref:50S ribosome-binding GTPase n=1 Tax=Geodermatophilus pulveris TaxID=1564159 RepID=A0A239GJL5_9ACTN|nr:GTPase [Geodermatophilus pulveris]SNS68968.1 50S ribosome-binding GTPase [Geodermatophilus pulveris]